MWYNNCIIINTMQLLNKYKNTEIYINCCYYFRVCSYHSFIIISNGLKTDGVTMLSSIQYWLSLALVHWAYRPPFLGYLSWLLLPVCSMQISNLWQITLCLKLVFCNCNLRWFLNMTHELSLKFLVTAVNK